MVSLSVVVQKSANSVAYCILTSPFDTEINPSPVYSMNDIAQPLDVWEVRTERGQVHIDRGRAVGTVGR